MNRLKFLLFSLIMLLPCTVFAQNMSCQLDITVKSVTGESVTGIAFELSHTDYSIFYQNTVLDSQGKYSAKVYAGNHHISIKVPGLKTYENDFMVTEAGYSLNVVMEEAVRLPFALKAEVNHDIFSGNNDVMLSWNKEEPVFFDDFESHEDWSLTFGQWTGIDGDKLATAALVGSYPNRAVMQYAQIINPLTVEPAWWYEYPVLRPYSGQQYVGFIRTQSGEANDDWLITPTLKIGNENVISFMAKAGDRNPEPFEVCITTAENPTKADFTPISSGNYETVSYETWVKKTYDLSEYVGQNIKIAIHYIGDATRRGNFMLMIDDFYVGQAETEKTKAKRISVKAQNSNEKFEIYLDNNKVGETYDNSFLIQNVTVGNHKLGVKAIYKTTSTEIVELPLEIKNEFSHLTFNISSNSKASVDGLILDMINKNCGEQISVSIKNGKVDLASVPWGTYAVNIKSDIYENYLSEMTLNSDKTVNIELKEIIFDPFNIAVDYNENAEGKFDINVSWNKDLGFNDSFESYNDFATGKFGNWQSIDIDKMPVYPIALGSIENVISFPGSGTQSAPTAIAPIVFNPYKTKPAMLPADPAIAPTNGNKAIVFFSSQRAKSDKWLIAPQQTIRDSYVLRLKAKAYAAFAETIEICISETDDKVESFTALDKIDLGTKWTEYELNLENYKDKKVYIAIHYTTYDGFLSMLDEFYVGPKTAINANVGNVVNYEVYFDGKLIATVNDANYLINNASNGEHKVGIKAIYATGASELVEYSFNISAGVEDVVNDDDIVNGINGGIFVNLRDCNDVEVFNLSGQAVARYSQVEGEMKIQLSQGIYLVKVGDKIYKTIVY